MTAQAIGPMTIRQARQRVLGTIVALVALATVSGPILAQSDSASRRAFAVCAGIADDQTRLACFDDALGAETTVDPGRPAREAEPIPIAVEDPPEPPATNRERVTIDARGGSRSRDDDQSDAAVEVTIAQVREDRLGGVRFVTSSGEVWQVSGSRSGRIPEAPFPATIVSGSLGSYFLLLPDSNRRVRVQRRN